MVKDNEEIVIEFMYLSFYFFFISLGFGEVDIEKKVERKREIAVIYLSELFSLLLRNRDEFEWHKVYHP